LVRNPALFVALLLASAAASAQRGASAPAAAVAPADEWRQFRGTPSGTGNSASAPPATLKVLWMYQLGDIIESSVAIAGGVVYVGGGNGDLDALDLASGKLKWKYTTGNLIGESSPAVGPDMVYIGDLAGIFHAVRIADGSKAWTFKTMSEIKSSPVIAGDIVLIGSYDTHLYALDARTGALRWKVATNGMVHATPVIQNGLAFITGCDSKLRAVRISDGKEIWKFDCMKPTMRGTSPTTPLVVGHRIVNTPDCDWMHVVAFDRDTPGAEGKML